MKAAAPAAGLLAARPRLFDAIDRNPATTLVWVGAPAGSGKTSLLATYVRDRAGPSLWYQVDASDADPAALFLALAEGSDATAADRGCGSLPVYDASCAPRLRPFARQFGASLVARHGGRLLLVLDDFHEMPEGSTLATVVGEMAEATAGLRIVVASRLAPPPGLARLQVHGRMAVIGWSEMRLTPDEAAAVLAAAPRAGEQTIVDPGQAEALYRASDGWAAGLVLLAHAARASAAEPGLAPGTRLGADAPERGLLGDYLAHEVLAYADGMQRQVLAATALLPEFDRDAVGLLLGDGAASAAMPPLDRLPFLVRRTGTPDQARWSHHPLLREYLRDRLDEVFGTAEARALRRRATRWLLDHGDVEPGLRLLDELAEPDLLAAELLARARRWIAAGRNASVEAWIGRLPPATIERDPWLHHWLGKAQMPRSPAKAAGTLERAAAGFRAASDRRGLLLTCAAILDAVSYGYTELQRLGPWLDEAVNLLPSVHDWADEQEHAEVMASLFAALAVRQRPRPLLEQWRTQALSLAARSTQPTLRAYVSGAAAMSYVWSGDYAAAAAIAPRLRADIQVTAAGTLARLTGWLVLSVIEGNMPGPEVDDSSVRAGLALAEATGVHVWDAELHGQGAVIALTQGDLARAQAALDAMARCLPDGASVHSAGWHCFTAWRCLLAGDAVGAVHAAEAALADAAACGSVPLRRHALVMASQAAMAIGRDEAARVHVDRLGAADCDPDHPRNRFVRGLLRAELARRAGDLDAACEPLAEALEVGAAAAYTAFYGWQPGMMAEIAVLALQRGIAVPYVQSLVRLRRLTPAQPPLNVTHWPWPVRIRTLGGLAIEGLPASQRVGVRKPVKPIELLLLLAAGGGRESTEDEVCDALWPHADGDAAQRSLESNVHRLRRLLPDADLVRVASGRLSLDPHRVWSDVAALGQWVDDAERAADRSPEALARVLALYRGPFLPQLAADWAARTRSSLRRRVAEQIARLLDADPAADNPDWARAMRARARALDPDEPEWTSRLGRPADFDEPRPHGHAPATPG